MAILSLNEILRNEIQEFLGGSDSVLIKTVLDLTPRVRPGMDRVTIPRVSGLALESITSGTRAAAGGMTFTGDALLLDQAKRVPEYIDYTDGMDSAVDMKAAFLEAAPRVFAEGVEQAIAGALATVSPNDFDSASSTAGQFSIDDIAKAKKLLDQAGVPKSDRYMAVNADAMEILSSMQEFQDGSKSLSDEALRQGVVSQVKGFKVVQSEDVGSTTAANNKIHFYHRSAVAFALHDQVKYVEKDIPEFAQEYIAIVGKFGVKALDAGARKLTMSLTVATA